MRSLLSSGDTTQHRACVFGVNEEPLGFADAVSSQLLVQFGLGRLTVIEMRVSNHPVVTEGRTRLIDLDAVFHDERLADLAV
jgi:hypothetical protein